MDKEKLINQIMKECADDGEPVTREEAEEMAEMEIKSKKDCRRYEGDTKKRKTANRTKKVDEEKNQLMIAFSTAFLDFPVELQAKIANVNLVNPEREITFTVGENEYSLTLTKHRKKK